MQDKEKRIIDAAVTLLSEKGYSNTTMQDIAEAAQVGKGTVYRIFESKDEMISYLLSMYIDEIAARIHAALVKITDPMQKMRSIIRIELDYHDENPNLAQFMVRELLGTRKRFVEHIKKIRESRLVVVEQIIRDGIKREQFKNVDPRTVASGLEGMILASLVQWFLFTDEYPKDLIRENIETLFFQGILT